VHCLPGCAPVLFANRWITFELQCVAVQPAHDAAAALRAPRVECQNFFRAEDMIGFEIIRPGDK